MGMSGLVVEHVITRSVRDSAVMLDVAAGPDIGDPYYAPPQPGRYLDAIAVPPRRLRIAFSVLDPFGNEIDPECRAAVTIAANLCANLGHEVEEGHPPIEVDKLASDFMSIWASGLATLIEGIARLTGKRPTADCFQGLSEYNSSGVLVTSSFYCNSRPSLNKRDPGVSISRSVDRRHDPECRMG